MAFGDFMILMMLKGHKIAYWCFGSNGNGG
jgi:hypothetical protein